MKTIAITIDDGDELIAAEIKKVYDQSRLKEEMKFTEVFSILTAPIHLSFINDAEVELLKIAVEVKRKPQRREELLREHQQNYFWIRNNYYRAYRIKGCFCRRDCIEH